MTLRAKYLTLLTALLWAWLGALAQRAVEPQYGLVTISVASLRAEPRQGAELETQALMGTPLTLTGRTDDAEWWRARTPEGYEAWINCSSFVLLDSAQMHRWRDSRRLIVTDFDPIHLIDPATGERVTDLVWGCILEADSASVPQGYTALRLPDGRRGAAETARLADFGAWARDTVPDTTRMLQFARSMAGVPYLWGGMSTKMNDCSGYTKLLYACGTRLILPRNASQQALTGQRVDLDRHSTADFDAILRPGDLLFFVNSAGRVNHVGIYEADGWFWHSTGRVRHEHLSPAHPAATPKTLSHAVRLISVLSGLPTFATSGAYFNHTH